MLDNSIARDKDTFNKEAKKRLETALEYLRRGGPVIPCHSIRNGRCTCGKADCDKPGKHSLIKWKEFQTRLPTEEEVEHWLKRWPFANIGIVTGAISGLVVLDVDGAEGAEAVAERHLPQTIISETGGGGWHYFFEYPEGSNIGSRTGLLNKVDIRADGGYVLAPPSNHISEKLYKWFPGCEPGKTKIAPAPAWLIEALQPSKNQREVVAPVQKRELLPCAVAFLETGTAQGTRDICLFTLAKHCRRAGMDEAEALATLERANAVCSPPLPLRELQAKVNSAYNGQAGQGYSSLGCDEGVWQPFCPGRESCPALNPVKGAEQWPADLPEEAFYGLAGEVVRAISPFSEADEAALLLNFLVGFGNLIGSGPHAKAGPDRHGANLFAVLVGETAKGRKGASWGWVREIFKVIDADWALYKTPGGLSSGEGLIWQVRDPITQKQPIKEKGRVVDYEEVEVDPGIADKRLLVVEAEFSSALKVMARAGNTLSDVVRKAWDGGVLQSLTKNSQARATGAHIAIIGHITKQELLRYLTETEAGNGFGNRFLWCCVKRSKFLPDGATMLQATINQLASKVHEAVMFAQGVRQIIRDEEAAEIWRAVYPSLSEGKPGLLGSMTARAEAQVLRLACIYALLDKSHIVKKHHLLAALAVWERCEASAKYIFGDRTGDPIAETILENLQGGPLTQTEISNLFGRHKTAEEISRALHELEAQGRILRVQESTSGRTRTVWKLGAK